MLQALSDFFRTGGFLPHGSALLWRQDLMALNLGADILVAIACLSIALAVVRVVVLRGAFGYPMVTLLFAAFIASFAVSHIVGAVTLWLPLYGVEAVIKAGSAALAILAAALLTRLLQEIVAIPGPQVLAAKATELAAKAVELASEALRREVAEAALQEAHATLGRVNLDLERRVLERTADLVAANEELERFAYIASHDLRAPLRALMTVPDWLRETLIGKYGEVAPEVEQDLAELVVQSNRLDQLLTDLLVYARIGQSGELWALVQPEDLIVQSATLVGRPERFSIEIATRLPDIRCIPTEFALIMRNLIANAVKHHDRDQGRITIAGRVDGETAIIEVSDDGPGIESKYADKVFEMFSTLKPRDEVEGSGMGLAMVKKIMERSGGKVRLAGTDGKRGAVFELAFPTTQHGIPINGGNSVQNSARGRQPLLGSRLQSKAGGLG